MKAADTHVTTALRGRMDVSLVKVDSRKFQIFKNGRWDIDGTADEHESCVLEEFKQMFGMYHYDDVLDSTHVCVPPPFENNAFAAVCAKFMLKHLPRDVDVPDLDSDNHMVVLDNGGQHLGLQVWCDSGLYCERPPVP